MSDPTDTCPQCGMTNPYGIEIRGGYDGVLIWECPACNHMWPRFTSGPRHKRGLETIARWEAARK
jgi:hypothetical protein